MAFHEKYYFFGEIENPIKKPGSDWSNIYHDSFSYSTSSLTDFITPKSLNFHQALCHDDQTSNPLKIKMVPSSVQLYPCNLCKFNPFLIIILWKKLGTYT